MKIDLILDEIQLHIKRIDSVLPDIESWLPLSIEDFDDTEKIKTIDSFIYRFIKLQDKLGEKLFPAVLQLLEEYDSKMPFIDILNKLEKLEIIPSSEEWIDFRNLRNTLTHEYPDNEDEIIEAVAVAVRAYKDMLGIYNNIVKYIVNRRREH